MAVSPVARLRHYVDGLIDRALAVAGAAVFAQAPEFFQQYLQRLGGHLDEARRQLAAFEHTAAQAGLSLDQFIRQTAANADPAVARLADVMSAANARVEQLGHAYAALHDAGAWTRPIVFLRDLDHGIVRSTMHAFQPAMPVTLEGLCYAVAGMVVCLAFYHLALRRLIVRSAPVSTPKP